MAFYGPASRVAFGGAASLGISGVVVEPNLFGFHTAFEVARPGGGWIWVRFPRSTNSSKSGPQSTAPPPARFVMTRNRLGWRRNTAALGNQIRPRRRQRQRCFGNSHAHNHSGRSAGGCGSTGPGPGCIRHRLGLFVEAAPAAGETLQHPVWGLNRIGRQFRPVQHSLRIGSRSICLPSVHWRCPSVRGCSQLCAPRDTIESVNCPQPHQREFPVAVCLGRSIYRSVSSRVVP